MNDTIIMTRNLIELGTYFGIFGSSVRDIGFVSMKKKLSTYLKMLLVFTRGTVVKPRIDDYSFEGLNSFIYLES